MDKNIFTVISDHLESNVPDLRWIDYDSGQLDIAAERPPVALPACLIDINYPDTDYIDEEAQIVNVDISFRVAFRPTAATNSNAPVNVRAEALSIFDTIEAMHSQLQGFTGNYQFSPLNRRSAVREKRRDGLPVYRLVYQTTFHSIKT